MRLSFRRFASFVMFSLRISVFHFPRNCLYWLTSSNLQPLIDSYMYIWQESIWDDGCGCRWLHHVWGIQKRHEGQSGRWLSSEYDEALEFAAEAAACVPAFAVSPSMAILYKYAKVVQQRMTASCCHWFAGPQWKARLEDQWWLHL